MQIQMLNDGNGEHKATEQMPIHYVILGYRLDTEYTQINAGGYVV